MKKFILIFVVAIIVVFNLSACSKDDSYSVITENQENILIVDADNLLDDYFEDLCQITKTVPVNTNKRYKFIVLSDGAVSSLNNSDIAALKESIYNGYFVIYPQHNNDKISNFIRLFSAVNIYDNYELNGCTLKRELNTGTQSYYIQATPSFSNRLISEMEYVKSAIETVITLDLPYKDKSELMGVYMSKAVYEGRAFKELSSFSNKTVYDKFDAFDDIKSKKFEIKFDDKRQGIIYSTNYIIDKSETEYFYLYIIVKDFYGNIRPLLVNNSTFVHSGLNYSLTEELQVYSGIRAYSDFTEYLHIKLEFV